MPLTVSTDAFEVVTDPAAAPSTAAVDRPVRSDALDTLGATPNYLAASGFDGAAGSTALMAGIADTAEDTMPIALGLGSDDLTAADVRKAAANLWRAASKVDSLTSALATVAADDLGADVALAAVVEGMLLASYGFNEHKGEPPEADALGQVVLAAPDGTDTAAAVARAAAVAGGIALARDLVNQPAGALTASGLADAATEAIEAASADGDPAAGAASVEVVGPRTTRGGAMRWAPGCQRRLDRAAGAHPHALAADR